MAKFMSLEEWVSGVENLQIIIPEDVRAEYDDVKLQAHVLRGAYELCRLQAPITKGNPLAMVVGKVRLPDNAPEGVLCLGAVRPTVFCVYAEGDDEIRDAYAWFSEFATDLAAELKLPVRRTQFDPKQN